MNFNFTFEIPIELRRIILASNRIYLPPFFPGQPGQQQPPGASRIFTFDLPLPFTFASAVTRF